MRQASDRQRWRVVLGLLCAAVLLGAALALADSFYRHALRSVEEQVERQMRLLTDQTARSIEDLIHDCRVEIEWLVTLPEVKTPQADSAAATFDTELRDKPYFTSLFRLDANGILRTYRSREPGLLAGVLGKDFSFREYFQTCRSTGRSVVSPPLLAGGDDPGVKNKFLAVILAAPCETGQKEFAGVVGVDMSIDMLVRRFIKPLQLDAQGGGWLVSSDGHVIANPTMSHVGQRLPAGTAGLGNPADVLGHISRLAGDGESMLRQCSRVSIGADTWFVAMELPRGYALKLVAPLYDKLVLLMLCVTATVVVGMTVLLVTMHRVADLKAKVHQLEIRIDEQRQHEEVAQITGSEYFQSLLDKVDVLRQSDRSDKDGS